MFEKKQCYVLIIQQKHRCKRLLMNLTTLMNTSRLVSKGGISGPIIDPEWSVRLPEHTGQPL